MLAELGVINVSCFTSERHYVGTYTVYLSFHWLAIANSLLNPLLYTFVSARFRVRHKVLGLNKNSKLPTTLQKDLKNIVRHAASRMVKWPNPRRCYFRRSRPSTVPNPTTTIVVGELFRLSISPQAAPPANLVQNGCCANHHHNNNNNNRINLRIWLYSRIVFIECSQFWW